MTEYGAGHQVRYNLVTSTVASAVTEPHNEAANKGARSSRGRSHKPSKSEGSTAELRWNWTHHPVCILLERESISLLRHVVSGVLSHRGSSGGLRESMMCTCNRMRHVEVSSHAPGRPSCHGAASNLYMRICCNNTCNPACEDARVQSKFCRSRHTQKAYWSPH
jgi:hypothetical protein